MVKTSRLGKKLYIVVLSFFSIFVVLVLFMILRKNVQSLVDQRKELVNSEADLVNLDKVTQDYKNRQMDIEKVLSSVPKTYEEISQYAKKLESIANQSNLQIVISFDKSQKSETNGLNSTGVNIKSSGSYSGLVEFIDNLSNLPYQIEIDTIKLEKGEGILNLDLSYRLYTAINK
jgi:Tfp pilus assembly protein PilO